jgi:NTP pyrophosphatase (non-canonical NTP hydrolase)
MDFETYQRDAAKTSTLRLEGPAGAIAPMLGLASETGSILNSYKKYLRDGISLTANIDQLREEIGDLLWYASAISTACGISLDDIAQENLRRTKDRYLSDQDEGQIKALPLFDANFPETERFPRKLVVAFSETVTNKGKRQARIRLVSAEPNAFPDGRRVGESGKETGFTLDEPLGDPLDDNTRTADAYRYHDAIHLGFLAVLGWSPNTRSLLKLKRKSDEEVDNNEDGARAIFAEEGLAAVLSRLAVRRSNFLKEASVDNEVIELAKAASFDLEVEVLPGWLWRRAIVQGFTAYHQLAANGGGFLTVDLEARQLRYDKYR